MAGSEISKPTRVRIPGSNVFMVDADGNGDFSPPSCFPLTGQINPQKDYYEDGPRPVCPEGLSVVGALGKIGLSQLWKVDMSRVRKEMELCHTLLNSPTRDDRVRAATESSTLPSLIKALHQDSEETVRAAAARSLVQLKNKAAISAFVKSLQEDKSPLVRRSIVEKLDIGWKDPTLLTALKKILKEDPDPEIRKMAALSLGRFKDLLAFFALGEALADKSALVREAAGQAFEEVGDPSATLFLEEALEKHQTVPRSAFAALAKLAGKAAVPPLDRFLQGDGSEEMRAVAAETLGTIMDKSAIAPLVAAAENDKSETVRLASLGALKKLSEQIETSAIVSVQATLALGDLEIKDAAPALEKILKEGVVDEASFLRAAKALQKLDHLKKDDNNRTELILAERLGKPKNDDTSDLRKTICLALGEIGTLLAVSVLLEISQQDQDPAVRLAANSAFNKIAGKFSVSELKKTIHDVLYHGLPCPGGGRCRYYDAIDESFAHNNLYGAILMLGKKTMSLDEKGGAFSIFLTALTEKSFEEGWNIQIREAAAISLGEIGDPSAIAPLQKAQKDKSEKVRKAATEAIDKITGKFSTPVRPLQTGSITDKNSALPFMGFSTSDPRFSSEILSQFTEAFFVEAKRKKLKVVIPNIPEIADKLKIPATCSDIKCTAEICGAMGASSGFYGKIEWMESDQKYMIRLHRVLQENATISHRATLFVSKAELKKSGPEIARKLAQIMFAQL